MENCENCDVDDQPDPEAECEECMRRALERGRTVGISPETEQVIQIRSLIKVGYRFDPDELQHWQWQCLVEVDRAVENWRAEQVEKASR